MKTSLIGAITFVLLGATACEKPVDESPLNTPGVATDTPPPSRRLPPARSGIGSDPDNPSGAPGPGSGLGTSLTR